MSAPPDPWSDEQLAAQLAAARRDVEVGRLQLLAAMANCGIPAPEQATANELLDILERRGRELARRLGLPTAGHCDED